MPMIDEPQSTPCDAQPEKAFSASRSRSKLRLCVLYLFRVVLGLVGTVVAICLIYVLFFLRDSQATPGEWQRKTGPVTGFEIPDFCPVEKVETNPYTKPDFAGYSIHRYHFTPDNEEISDFFIDWFDPKGKKPEQGYPLVMNAPITGGGMELENIFSRHFADHGMAVCLVHRPKEYDRQPVRMERSGYWWRMMTRQSRIAYHWALQREEIDPDRTASFGISNGGFRHTFFAATEPDVRAHVICLAGGDLVNMLCVSDFFVEAREQFMKERGFDAKALRAWLETTIDLEPTDYAPYVDPASVLMFCARLDRIVPYKNGLRLWEAFGRPAMIAVPLGHYSSAFAIPYIKYAALDFIRGRFDAVSGE
ncbi:MAG: hypothetical protein ABIH23_31380 [bacterium]